MLGEQLHARKVKGVPNESKCFDRLLGLIIPSFEGVFLWDSFYCDLQNQNGPCSNLLFSCGVNAALNTFTLRSACNGSITLYHMNCNAYPSHFS